MACKPYLKSTTLFPMHWQDRKFRLSHVSPVEPPLDTAASLDSSPLPERASVDAGDGKRIINMKAVELQSLLH